MRNMMLRTLALFAAAALAASQNVSAQAYKVANLISDGSVAAAVTDANFINPWAISASPTWWISAQGTGFNYVIPATGLVNFKVIVPAASNVSTATGLPAGSVTTAGAATGMILPNGTKASFLFSTLDGTLSGWNSRLGTANALSQIVVNNAAAGASYRGLAMLTVGANSYLLAPNFGTGNAIEVYDSTFKPVKLAGTFVDPTLPAGYAPSSVHVLGTQVFVAYALRTTATPYRTVNAPGNGMVSVFDTAGNFVARAVTGGNLNAPWGVAIAPANFGVFSNALLIGNFGDGLINAYDAKTYGYLGQLMDSTGKSLTYASLWELLPGATAVTGTAAVSGGDPSTVYFTAGLTGEAHGLFGAISNGTVAGSTAGIAITTSSPAGTVTAGNSVQTGISVVPVNGFSGQVTLTCSGLPAGASCAFSSFQSNVVPTASTVGTVLFETAKATARTEPLPGRGRYAAGIASAALLLVIVRRRRSVGLRLVGVVLMLGAVSGLVVGCYDGPAPVTATPAGQSTVTIMATAGSVTSKTTFGLTVQ